jgi:hypothetical protein
MAAAQNHTQEDLYNSMSVLLHINKAAVIYSSNCYSYTVIFGIQNGSIYFTSQSGIFSKARGGKKRIQ